MPNSNEQPQTALTSTWLVLCESVLLAACSVQSVPNVKAPAAPHLCVVIEGNASSKDNDLIAELERTIKTSPFYTIPASTEELTSCDVRLSPERDIELEYHFRNGSWLKVKRNERIEYMELNVRLNQKLTDQPETILARAERAAFGASGCGIDWLQSETHPSADDRNETETLFYGDICNCQARIRHSGSSHAVELMLKSAC